MVVAMHAKYCIWTICCFAEGALAWTMLSMHYSWHSGNSDMSEASWRNAGGKQLNSLIFFKMLLIDRRHDEFFCFHKLFKCLCLVLHIDPPRPLGLCSPNELPWPDHAPTPSGHRSPDTMLVGRLLCGRRPYRNKLSAISGLRQHLPEKWMVALHSMDVRYGRSIRQTGHCRPQGVDAVDHMSSCPLRAHVVYAIPNVLKYDWLLKWSIPSISAPVASESNKWSLPRSASGEMLGCCTTLSPSLWHKMANHVFHCQSPYTCCILHWCTPQRLATRQQELQMRRNRVDGDSRCVFHHNRAR